MHSVPNDLNISSAEVNEVEKYIKYFLVYAFCSELAATGKSGMVNVEWDNVSHCSKTLNFRNPFLLRMQLLKLQKKCSNSAILMPRKFGPVYVQVTKMHITETILNFRNVQVVLGKEYVTIRAGQPKSKQHMHVKCSNGTILHSIVVYFQIKTEIY